MNLDLTTPANTGNEIIARLFYDAGTEQREFTDDFQDSARQLMETGVPKEHRPREFAPIRNQAVLQIPISHEKIASLRNAGFCVPEIAEFMSCTSGSVRRVLVKLGMPGDLKQPGEELREPTRRLMHRQRAEGRTPGEIASSVYMTAAEVRAVLKGRV